VLNCQGFYEPTGHIGLVYQLPSSVLGDPKIQCATLSDILMNPQYTELFAESLRNRLEVAKSLATTIFSLHSVQWVHKSFKSENIIFFGCLSENHGVFDWSSPYLLGFDTSRADRAFSDRTPSSRLWEHRVYTHPLRQKEGEWTRFRKSFYSLGVVLLEIGLLKCFKDDHYGRSSEWTNIPPAEVHKRLVRRATALKRIMGDTYSEVVRTCLEGTFGVVDDDADETGLSYAFRGEVCEYLDQIRY
jgi:hypothetical protein